jgi:hypothetical protein
MFLQVTTRNGIKKRMRGGYSFGPAPRIVELDENDQKPRAHPKNAKRRESLQAKIAELEGKLMKLEALSQERLQQGSTLWPSEQADRKTLMVAFERAMDDMRALNEDDQGAPSSTGGGAARLAAIMEDADPVHGGLIVTKLSEKEARRMMAQQPEVDADRVPPDVATEMDELRARILELEVALSGKRVPAPEGEGGEQSGDTPAGGEGGGDPEDRSGRQRLGRNRK